MDGLLIDFVDSFFKTRVFFHGPTFLTCFGGTSELPRETCREGKTVEKTLFLKKETKKSIKKEDIINIIDLMFVDA